MRDFVTKTGAVWLYIALVLTIALGLQIAQFVIEHR